MVLPVHLDRVDGPLGRDRLTIRVDRRIRASQAGKTGPTVRNLSASGFWIATDLDIAIGASVSLGLSGIGVADAIVMRRQHNCYECIFLVPLKRSQLIAGLAGSYISRPDFASFGRIPAESLGEDGGLYPPRRWAGWIRLLVITGGAALAWLALIAAVRLLF